VLKGLSIGVAYITSLIMATSLVAIWTIIE
jgi:hypothetical protein